MTDLDLDAIRERYTLALNAKPSKGPYSEKGITALTDSVCDVPELMAKIDRLNAKLAWFETRFPCDGGCIAANEAQEDCSQHGWTPQQLWDELDARTSDWRLAESTIKRVRGVCTTGVNHAGTQLGWNRFRDAILRALEGGDAA